MRVVLVGLSHRVAPVELRERVALDLESASSLARRLADQAGEAVCLSTCNRTELYLASSDAGKAEELAAEALAELAQTEGARVRSVVYRRRDEEAALHVFRVAAGLDSLVPGEGEILGQVRAAYERGAPGPFLHRLFRHAIHVGKRVRSQTAIGENPASVSSAAAALAEQLFGDLSSCSVLLMGAGKIAVLAARSLVSRGARIGFVANRSPARARRLAEQVGAQVVALEDVPAHLAHVDVVVSSTGSPGYVLLPDDVAPSLRRRRGRPLFLIDIAVPRDLHPAIHSLEGCYLYDIDDLERVVAESLAGRREAAARAEEIVRAEVERFRAWQASREVTPAIASLRARAEEIRVAELERARARLGRLSEPERRVVETVTARIVDKLLHLPTVRMKEAAAAADGPLYAYALRHLFGLEDDAASGRHPRQ